MNELYKPGQVYEFPVKSITGGGRLVVEDANKLFFKVRGGIDATGLRPGDKVRCRFVSIEGIKYNLVLDESNQINTGLPMIDPERLVEVAGIEPSVLRWALTVLRTPDFVTVRRKLEADNPVWLPWAVEMLYRRIPEWLKSTRLTGPGYDRRLKNVTRRLDALGSVARYMLEGSGFLRGSLRRQTQQRDLTEIVQGAEAYTSVATLLTGRQAAGRFIDDLLLRLKESGYLYHPAEQFLVLTTLFRCKPELVNSSMGRIFDAILSWELDNWKVEPFRSAFVEQLELFIEENSDAIDNMSPAETIENRERIIKTVTALAIQSLINDKDKDAAVVSTSRNRALFFRYLSLLRKEQSDILLDKAWITALGAELKPEYDWRDTKQLTMLITKASVGLDPVQAERLSSRLRRSFVGETGVIDVTPEGVSLRALSERRGSETTWPAGLLEWHNLHVTTREDIGAPNRSKLKDIKANDKMWANIERILFLPETADRSATVLRHPEKDEQVFIRITGVVPDSDRQLFRCVTDDENYVECTGVLRLSDIVPFKVRYGLPLTAFQDPDTNRPLIFDAKVSDVDASGQITFSLSHLFDEYVMDEISVGESTRCVVTNHISKKGSAEELYSVLSEKGYCMVAAARDGMELLDTGAIVQVMFTGRVNGMLEGDIQTVLPPSQTLDSERVVTNLLRSVGIVDEYVPEQTDDDDFDQEVQPMSVEQVRELINIIRLQAVAAHDAVKANNYLAYAGCMARIIGDERLEMICRQHRRLLNSLQYFVLNKSLETDWTKDLDEGLIREVPVLDNLYRRLSLISCLGQDDRSERLNDELMRYVNDSADETMAMLSRLVISYQMLSDSGLTEQLNPILQEIRRLLNINIEEQTLKFYFDETQYTEFKPSFVFPPKRKGQNPAHVNPELQETEIMQIICGFMNSTGGTLYLGVNNYGYESGLDDDLSYLKMTLDNLNVRIDNTVRRRLGANAGNYVRIQRDPEAKRDVLMIRVEPSPRPVRLDGKTIFVRQSTSTVPMLGEAEANFVDERHITFEQARKANEETTLYTPVNIAVPQSEPDSGIPSHASVTEQPDVTEIQPSEVEVMTGVQTDRFRPNVQHDYEDGFTPVAGYIYFVNDNEFIISRGDLFMDTDPATRVSLAVSADEAGEQLLLAYAGEMAVRVPMRELFDKEPNRAHRHADNAELRFVSPIHRGEALLSVHTDSKGNLYYRVTPYDEIEQGSINSTGQRLLNVPCGDTVAWAVIPAAMLEQYSSAIHPAGRSIGKSLRASYGTPDGDEALTELLAPLANRH